MRKTRQRILGIVLAVVVAITLFPTSALAAANRSYAFRVHTADVRDAGTDATIRVGFHFYDYGRAGQHDFGGKPGFEQGDWDWCGFSDATADPWMANQVYVGNDGGGIASGWTPSEVEIYMPYVAGSSDTRYVGQVRYPGVNLDTAEMALDCSHLTRRSINHLGGFESWSGTEYIDASTSGTLRKTWNCQINDNYCYNGATYNPWTMQDPPTLTVTPSNSAINCYTFKENGASGQASFELDYKTLYDQMYEEGIGRVTFNFSTIFPSRSTSNYAHTKSLTIYRTCFDLGNQSIAQSPTYSPMKDNCFFNKEKTDVTITLEPNTIHLMNPTANEKNELAANFVCTPELYVNKEDGEKLCDMTYSQANGVITFKGTIPQDRTSDQYGVRLQLNDVSSKYNNRPYTLNRGTSKSIMFTTHKVDTISPTVSMVDQDSAPLSIQNTIKQVQPFYMIGSETLYHSQADVHGTVDERLFRYSLFQYNATNGQYSNVASQITDYNGTGSSNVAYAPINTTVLKDCPINLKLAQHEEGNYKLRVYACDFANNGLGDGLEYIDYDDIYVDNLAPRVRLEKIVQNQVPDGTKRIDCEFSMTDLAINSGVDGSWARTYYCFVPICDVMPEPDMAKIESGELGSTMNKWAFVEGGTTASTAIFKIIPNQTFEGTMYYFTLDSAGNNSRTELKKVFEEPIDMANYDTRDTLVTNSPSYPHPRYEITFTDEKNMRTQYHWLAKDLGSSFRQSYIQFEAGADVGAGTQITDDGTEVLMNGNFTLEYKVTEQRSGNYKVFTRDYYFDNASPEVKLTWVHPNLSALAAQQANVRITDMSGITLALYRIVNPDGSLIDGYADTDFTLAPNAENVIEVKDTLTFSLDKSGVYGLRISARDRNNYSTLIQPAENGLFVLRKQKPEITVFDHRLTNKVGGIGVTNKGTYSLDISVTDQMLNAESLTKAQVVQYCISTDGSNYGPWTTAEGTMTVGANELTHHFVLENPTVLAEGDNTIYIKTACTDQEDNTTPASTLISDPKVLTIKLDSLAPTYDEIRYNNTLPTVENVIGTLRTSDFGTGVTNITCEDANVEISEEQDGFYTFTIKGDVETSATLTDLVENTVLVPIKVTNIDKDDPVVISTVEEVFSGDRKDAKITVAITEKRLSDVKFALLSDGSSTLDDAAYENFQKASTFETTKTTEGYETVYTIFARGMEGTFSLGVKATDSIGHVTETVSEPFTTTDIPAAIKSVSCDAMKTKGKTTVTVTFNTKVAVQAVGSTADALDAADGELLHKNAPLSKYSLTYDIVRSDNTAFALKVLDECGRVSTLSVSPPTVTFYTGNKIKTALTKNGYLIDAEGLISFSDADEIRLVIVPDAAYAGGQSFVMDESSVLRGFVFNESASVKSATDETAYTKLCFDAAHDDTTIKSVSFQSKTGTVVEPKVEEPKVEEPKVEEPAVVEPAVVETQVVETQAVEPAVVEPAVVEPAVVEPAVVEPKVVENEVVENEYIAISIFDQTAPECSVEYDSTKATCRDVTASVQMRDLETGITRVEEKQGDGRFVELELNSMMTLVFAENGVKTYRVTNGANMVTEFDVTVANIDKNPIVAGVDYTVKYRHQNYSGEWVPVEEGHSYNSVLAVIAPEASSGKVLSVSNHNGMSKILTREENTFTFHIADTADHTTEQVVSYHHFDNEASTITWALSNTEKTNQDVTATVTITDKQNPIEFAQIQSKEGVVYPWKGDPVAGEYSADLDASGIYTVTAYDAAGNMSTENIVVSNIDKVVPKITSLVYTIPQGTITARDVRVDIKEFSKANVKMLRIELDQGLKEADVLYTPGSQSIRFKKNGYVSAFFVDDYGNVGADVISVSNIYSKPPQLKAVTALAEDLLSASVKFEKEVDRSGMPLDPFRDLSELYVVYGGITYKASEAVFTLKNNADYSFLIFDASGSSQKINVKVSGIDDVAPKITKVSWSYDYLEQNGENIWESKTAQKTLTIGTDTSGTEAGYVVGEDMYHVTNGNVTVVVTTDKDTTPIGSTNKPSKEASIIYQENGLYIFNQQAANGTSDSYGVDVEVIDKSAPCIELKNGAELIFIEGNKDPNYAYDKNKLIDYAAYDVKKGEKIDLTSNVTIDYGTFDPEIITNNTFDRSSPYYINYTVFDAAGNKTVVRRTIRLVGFYDTIALINGVMPDSTSTATAVGSAMEITLKNFSGISYARYEKGIYTMGQMKTIGKTLVERNGAYTITGATEGWYTIYIQTDKRDYFNISVYYNPNEK